MVRMGSTSYSTITIIIGLSIAGPVYGQAVLAAAVCLFLFTPVRAMMQSLNLSYSISVTINYFSIYILLLLIAPIARLLGDIIGPDDYLTRKSRPRSQKQRRKNQCMPAGYRNIIEAPPDISPLSNRSSRANTPSSVSPHSTKSGLDQIN